MTVDVATILEAPVRRVTVLEDRAQVTREGRVWLTAGPHRLRLEHVAPVVVDKTVVTRAVAGGLAVHETSVVRTWQIGAAARPPDARAILEEYRRVSAELTAARAVHDLLSSEVGAADQAAQVILDAVNRELPHATEFVSRWTEDLSVVLADAREAAARAFDSGVTLADIQNRLATVLARASAEWRVDHDLVAELVIDVTAQTTGEHALLVEYVVPCAMWRPMHRAQLTELPGLTGPTAVRWGCDAAVWQATGEDWNDVALSFSTARPTQRAEPPRLEEDVLRLRKKTDKKIVVEVREQAIATTGEGADAKLATELQGVDDGGEARLMSAPTLATVPADGRLRRVPLFVFDTTAELDRIARPERSLLVHLRSRQTNAGAFPLLAGPVELVSHSGYVGSADIGYVAPGERFVLGWGGDETLRVARRATETRDTTRISGRQIITRRVSLFLSNLGDAVARFRIEERIPVSEIAEVQIEVDTKETRPAATPNDQGIVGWEVELPAYGTRALELVYRVTASSDVVL